MCICARTEGFLSIGTHAREGDLLEFALILNVLPPQRRVGTEEGVLGHISRVAARGRRAVEGLCHAADMVRCPTAAHAEVPDA